MGQKAKIKVLAYKRVMEGQAIVQTAVLDWQSE